MANPLSPAPNGPRHPPAVPSLAVGVGCPSGARLLFSPLHPVPSLPPCPALSAAAQPPIQILLKPSSRSSQAVTPRKKPSVVAGRLSQHCPMGRSQPGVSEASVVIGR